MKIKLIILLIFSAVVFPASSAFAIGVLARPDHLNIQSYLGQTASVELLVANNSDQPAIYSVYADRLKSQIKIEPENFKLEPGETRSVWISARFFWPGIYRSDISVLARSMSAGDLSALPGVKVPLSVEVGGWGLAVFLGALILLCLGTVFALKYRGLKDKNNNYEAPD